MLQKAIAEVQASRIAINALEGKATAWEKAADAFERYGKAVDKVNELQRIENDRLRAIKCNEKKYFWVIKSKTCF
jgi:hypothetical protein